MEPPVSVNLNSRRSRALEVKFVCDEECQGAIYPDGDTSPESETFSAVTTDGIVEFRQLAPQTTYRIVIRQRYKSRSWLEDPFSFGNWSHVLSATTCPDNMEGFADVENATCYALPGFYKSLHGSAENCKTLESELPIGALENACTGPGYTIQNLSIAAGFWRPTTRNSNILQCPKRDRCLGTKDAVGSPGQYCTDNHTGIYCSECIEGYKLGSAGCIECDETSVEESLQVFAITLALLVLAELFMFLYVIAGTGVRLCKRGRARPKRSMPRANKTRRSTKNVWHRFKGCALFLLKRTYVSTKLRILLGYFQVFFSFQRTFNRDAVFFNWKELAALDFVSSLSVFEILARFGNKCAFDFNHYHVLLFQTIMPFVMLLCLALLISLFVRACIRSPEIRETVRTKLVTAILFVLFLIYPTVSETVFSTFWCENFDETDANLTKSALRADFSLSCIGADDPTRSLFLAYAGVMTLVYPVGVLVLYGVLLHKVHGSCVSCSGQESTRFSVQDSNARRLETRGKKTISFLTSPYSEKFFWFETYELFRKLCQTSMLGFLQSLQLETSYSSRVFLPVVALNTCVVFMLLLTWLQPYERIADFAFALVSLCMLLPAAQINLFDPFHRNQATDASHGVLIWVEIGLFIVFVAFETIVLCCLSVKKDQDSSQEASSIGTDKDIEDEETGPVEVPSSTLAKEVAQA